MIQRINVKNKKIYFNYDENGELTEIIISDDTSEDLNSLQIRNSWLND